ncbi:cysteine hydrolase [Peptoniphilus sp. AGMB00490]|uniref:Cysteine hydrolase n=1 Tax=Peptoniphilus faecalis TaxID=2731255 RepID=A0A848RHJ2_9FIRM|nr:cysteine hydrolase [Peptoniphilus faecalis]NMW85251.1 cysteine hydrolase [Peptoniphilus faecalis]
MDISKSALILIDLQNGVTAVELNPHKAIQIIEKANHLINKFREENGFIVFVRTAFIDNKDILPADKKLRSLSDVKESFDQIDNRLSIRQNDYIVTKRGFSAFFGTDLDLELRRHDIENLVFAGVSTHIGIDTSAKDGYQLNYNIYFIEDAISAPKEKQHEFIVKEIFPLYGKVIKTEDLILD